MTVDHVSNFYLQVFFYDCKRFCTLTFIFLFNFHSQTSSSSLRKDSKQQHNRPDNTQNILIENSNEREKDAWSI